MGAHGAHEGDVSWACARVDQKGDNSLSSLGIDA